MVVFSRGDEVCFHTGVTHCQSARSWLKAVCLQGIGNAFVAFVCFGRVDEDARASGARVGRNWSWNSYHARQFGDRSPPVVGPDVIGGGLPGQCVVEPLGSGLTQRCRSV